MHSFEIDVTIEINYLIFKHVFYLLKEGERKPITQKYINGRVECLILAKRFLA